MSTRHTNPTGHPEHAGQPWQCFDRAAQGYEQHARVQPAIARHLAALIRTRALPRQARILEIGCGTGLLTQALAPHYPMARWLLTDLSPTMLEQARRKLPPGGHNQCRVMDGEHPAFPPSQPRFDLICSSMALQWFRHPAEGLARLARWLAPGGMLAVAVPTTGSLAEWRQAHTALCLAADTLAFPAAEQLRAAAAGLEGACSTQPYTDQYRNAREFLLGLKGAGATTPQAHRRPLGAGTLRAVCREFDRQGARCTYQVTFGLWHRPDVSTKPQHPPCASRLAPTPGQQS